MKDFAGKTAVITGGAGGIGRAMAELFLARGMNVVIGDIEQTALDKTVAELQSMGPCTGVVTDVSSAEDVQALAGAALQAYGAIHIACNNAGVFAGGLLWEESIADYQWQMDVNVWGVIHGIRTFIPIMKAQDEPCHVVNTASMAAVTAMPYSGIYHMTKHAVLALSESLYHELAFHAPNVNVSVLCPEAINTGIAQSERNRPTKYAGDTQATDESAMVHQALADSVAGGIGPEVMAQRVYEAIVEQRFYILSDEAWRASANVRLDDVRQGRNPTFAPPIQ
ncbi:MAG: SDR family NAD(P)-dependent oxidoreductase [Gammaproteobacteria bacterium]|jgi:NAD(P)-dependent dehydrogenase (short-subunit alcohol dehydrogenase family)|nr:SDR family NAD(P)-dependent oxidoreductase [Gammaproteobacteria bacterium]